MLVRLPKHILHAALTGTCAPGPETERAGPTAWVRRDTAADTRPGTYVDARLLPVGTVAAALTGAVLVVLLVSGPLWLLLPGLLGAALPALLGRPRLRPPSAFAALRRAPVDSG